MPNENIFLHNTPCGNLRISRPDFFVLDSNRAPYTDIRSEWIRVKMLEADPWTYFYLDVVNFTSKVLLVSYLNTIFVPQYSLKGEFYKYGAGIYYKNVDGFLTAEIMIEYGVKVLNIKIGTPDTLINTDYDLEFANPTFTAGECKISSPEFLGLKEFQLRVSNIDSEPIAGQHKYYDVDPDNDENGAFVFYYELKDSNVYASFSQKPE